MDGLDLDLGFEPIEFDAPEVVTPEADDNSEVVDTPEVDLEPTPEGEETPAEGEEEQPTDGRKLPDDVRKALKALRDQGPEHAKAARLMNDVYGREQAYRSVYPTVKDAQTAQSTIQAIDTYGGLDAVRTTIAEIEEIDSLLQAGDGKAVEKIFEVSGEGFGKIAPAMLDKLQASNPEAYAAAIRPHLVSAIGSSGLTEAFNAVIEAQQFSREAGASPEFKMKYEKIANEGLAKIRDYLGNLKTQAATPPPTAAAGTDRLSERETAIATREAQAFNTEVGTQANSKMNVSLEKAISPYLRQLKLGPQAKSDFVQGVYDEVAKLAKADKVYQGNKDAMFKSKTKDAGKIANLMASKFDEVVGTAAKTVAARRYGKSSPASGTTTTAKGNTTATVTGPGSAAKPILVKELPKFTDVDWNKTDDDMTMRGIRVLKSGKVVRLDR